MKAELARIAVIHPLTLGVVYCLPGVLIFQFKGKDRNTVEHEHHIYALFAVTAVIPLAINRNMVSSILCCCCLVQRGFGLEIANAEGDSPVLEAVAQNMEETVHIACVVEGIAEFFNGIDLVGIRKPHPLLRLRSLDKVDQRIDKQSGLGVINIFAFDITARRREQSRFNIGLKAFFVGFINGHLIHHQSSI